MKLYLDIDGVLLDYSTDTHANHVGEFIDYITSEYDCYWLTTHCKGDSQTAIDYLSSYLTPEMISKLKSVKATTWDDMKTEAIDFDYDFVWLDDYPFNAEIGVLEYYRVQDSLCRVNLSNENELLNVIEWLKEKKRLKRSKRRKRLMVLAVIILTILLGKLAWTGIACRNHGTFASEKKELIERRNYLLNEVVTDPQELINKMPKAVGPQFQGEWALYSCSMLSASLVNLSHIYPETKNDAIRQIDDLIQIVISPEIREYDRMRWYEDPLETLDGDESHVSYLSHLAWMISGYKHLTVDNKYDALYHDLCEAMNRRILQSPYLNLETYPGELIYVPDMLVAIVALSNYSKQYSGKYYSTVHSWLQNMQDNWIDNESGLLVSYIPTNDSYMGRLPIKGSYSALNCYYLTLIDEDFARSQYEKLKQNFLQERPIAGLKEYYDRKCWLGFDIDAGPILCNLSPTGTAFGLGSITYFKDNDIRRDFLRTAELAGSTVTFKGRRHYLLANVALVGEAIAFAMRTAVPWTGYQTENRTK